MNKISQKKMIISKDKKGQKSKINCKSERTRKNKIRLYYSKVIEGKGSNIYILLRCTRTKSHGCSQLIFIPKLNRPTLNKARATPKLPNK